MLNRGGRNSYLRGSTTPVSAPFGTLGILGKAIRLDPMQPHYAHTEDVLELSRLIVARIQSIGITFQRLIDNMGQYLKRHQLNYTYRMPHYLTIVFHYFSVLLILCWSNLPYNYL